jgi:putative endonuclease
VIRRAGGPLALLRETPVRSRARSRTVRRTRHSPQEIGSQQLHLATEPRETCPPSVGERSPGAFLARRAYVSPPKRFVYILKSTAIADEYYVGVTSDVTQRLAAHNAGLTPSTVDHRPWRALLVIEFDEEQPAIEFEQYLKTGSGREFARRHFRQTVARDKWQSSRAFRIRVEPP